MAQVYELSFLVKILDKATGPMRRVARGFDKLAGPIAKADNRLKRFSRSMDRVGKGMRKTGAAMSLKLTMPIALMGGMAIRSARNFQEAMNMVGAVTRTRGKDFDALKEKAKKLGAETRFTATQVAEGMKFLGMAGFEHGKILGTIEHALTLAASANMEVGEAAYIVTNIMASQRMEVEDLAHANDVLVNAFTNANTNLSELGEAFKYAGPITKDFGLTMEDTTSAIALMSQVGITGSMAGTALRGTLSRLSNASSDARKEMLKLKVQPYLWRDGKKILRPLVDIVKEFEEKGAKAGEMLKILGLRAGPGFAALITKGHVKFSEFVKLLERSGTANAVALRQMEGLPGAMWELASAFEAVQIAIMESSAGQTIVDVFRWMAKWLREMAKTNPKILAFSALIIGILGVLGPLVVLIGFLVTAIGAIGVPIVAVGALIVGLITSITFFWSDLKAAFEGMVMMIEDLWGWIKKIGSTNLGDIVKLPGWLMDKIKGTSFKAQINPQAGGSNVGGMGGMAAAAGSGWGRTQTDVNIKVVADEGSTAIVEQVRNKKGKANVKVQSEGYIGRTVMAGAF